LTASFDFFHLRRFLIGDDDKSHNTNKNMSIPKFLGCLDTGLVFKAEHINIQSG